MLRSTGARKSRERTNADPVLPPRLDKDGNPIPSPIDLKEIEKRDAASRTLAFDRLLGGEQLDAGLASAEAAAGRFDDAWVRIDRLSRPDDRAKTLRWIAENVAEKMKAERR